MLLQSLDDLGIDRPPFVGGFLLEFIVNRLRQSKIEPDNRLREITLSHGLVILLLR